MFLLPDRTPAWEAVARRLAVHEQAVELEAYRFVFASPMAVVSQPVRQFAQTCFASGTSVLAGAVALMQMIGADASHAWISVYVPGGGWVDLDPTDNLIVAESHITVAWGRNYGDVTPVKGVVMGGGQHRLSVSVQVTGRG